MNGKKMVGDWSHSNRFEFEKARNEAPGTLVADPAAVACAQGLSIVLSVDPPTRLFLGLKNAKF
jgi:hypothetical protein